MVNDWHNDNGGQAGFKELEKTEVELENEQN